MTELTADDVHGRLRDAAASEQFSPIRTAFSALGIDNATVVASIAEIDERPQTRAVVQRWRGEILGPGAGPRPYLLERYAILLAALHSVTKLTALAVPGDVVQMFLQEFVRLTAPGEGERDWYGADGPGFAAICKLVTLRRFPAGQFHWEVSGLVRSSFLRVRGFDRARLARAVLRLGGFSPVFSPHMPWRKQFMLLEGQLLLSYYRMAEAMRRQPRIRGLVAESWFHSPDTSRVSPHLAWLNAVFHEWDGVVVRSGPAGPLSGVFERESLRKRLADEGKFSPTLGLAVWPRRAMLRWADHYARTAS
jgi:hypothetical protein